MHFGRARVRDIGRPTDQHDIVVQFERRLGKCFSHTAARSVGQIAYRIEVLPRRTGSDEDASHAGDTMSVFSISCWMGCAGSTDLVT